MVTKACGLLTFSGFSDAIAPFLVMVVIMILAILWYLREGRNSALEIRLLRNHLGSPLDFQGTLAVADHRSGSYIRLSKSTKEARRLQFTYRWLVGIGRKAIFDEVVFDRSQQVVQLKKRSSQSFEFSDFRAIRMREVAGGRGGGSIWHVELILQKGKPIPFLTSRTGERRTTFQYTAPVAKAVSEIMEIPVEVFVAGNAWTRGWPPKAPK